MFTNTKKHMMDIVEISIELNIALSQKEKVKPKYKPPPTEAEI